MLAGTRSLPINSQDEFVGELSVRAAQKPTSPRPDAMGHTSRAVVEKLRYEGRLSQPNSVPARTMSPNATLDSEPSVGRQKTTSITIPVIRNGAIQLGSPLLLRP